ncbi:hypothetical protein CGRA01v4_00277 [Colletotrichum graminicola]|nr:hypothetical protein CGRA01v4_00277 [Colletotrichum graminicola]
MSRKKARHHYTSCSLLCPSYSRLSCNL